MNKHRILPTLSTLGLIFTTACTVGPESTLDYTDDRVTIKTQNGRDVPLRILTPDGCKACALIVFSHGANAAYDRYDKLLLPLAQAGYRVAIPNHTDSEEHPNREAFTPAQWMPTRLEDYSAIAAHYETDYLIAAGHSFGALIAQIAGGAQISAGSKIDPAYRPRAVLAYSPPGPVPNYIAAESWNPMTVPSLVTTGTTDIVPMMAEKWELHLTSYEEAPTELAYALIYQNMDHYMNGAYGRETESDTPERHKSIKHMIESSLFFVYNLRENGALTSAQWKTQEQDFVEARAQHE